MSQYRRHGSSPRRERGPPISAKQWFWIDVEMVPALSRLGLVAHRVLFHLIVENRTSAGRKNGRLRCTYGQLQARGVSKGRIKSAIAQLVGAGLVEVTRQGRPAAADLRVPSEYRLTFYATTDGTGWFEPTNEWRREQKTAPKKGPAPYLQVNLKYPKARPESEPAASKAGPESEPLFISQGGRAGVSGRSDDQPDDAPALHDGGGGLDPASPAPSRSQENQKPDHASRRPPSWPEPAHAQPTAVVTVYEVPLTPVGPSPMSRDCEWCGVRDGSERLIDVGGVATSLHGACERAYRAARQTSAAVH